MSAPIQKESSARMLRRLGAVHKVEWALIAVDGGDTVSLEILPA
jgi:hypothetical protein